MISHDMAVRDFEDLPWKTASDKILRDEAFSIAKNPKYDEYQRGLASMVYQFFDKKFSDGGVEIANLLNQESAKELYKPIIRKFNKQNIQWSFMDNIWGVGLAEMQLIKEFVFYYALLIFPLKDKKVIIITNTFKKILEESRCKPNKIWVDEGSEFYNR